MLIPLTSVQGKHKFGLAAGIIWCVERNAQNPLTTQIITTMNNGKGMVGYEVFETPEEVIDLIAQAAGKPVPYIPPPDVLVPAPSEPMNPEPAK